MFMVLTFLKAGCKIVPGGSKKVKVEAVVSASLGIVRPAVATAGVAVVKPVTAAAILAGVANFHLSTRKSVYRCEEPKSLSNFVTHLTNMRRGKNRNNNNSNGNNGICPRPSIDTFYDPLFLYFHQYLGISISACSTLSRLKNWRSSDEQLCTLLKLFFTKASVKDMPTEM
uniref:Uncharacterized protein n=1 Tax=Glossina palpalis gambiensis TaxID=67801 RepID=A0A1B0BEN0_9MUSC